MAIATCGHEVEEGISASIHSFTKEGEPCIDYGVYCKDCLRDYFEEGRLSSPELRDLLMDYYKYI